MTTELEVDLRATRRRRRTMERYVETTLLADGKFICPAYRHCRQSRHPDDAFREGIMSHVGRRFDLVRDGKPLRIVVVGQESGLPKGPLAPAFKKRVSMATRSHQVVDISGLERRYFAADGFPGRNPHMRGTTTALRLLVGAGLGVDYDGEWVSPVAGRRFHIFDGFALVNRLLCSAGPVGSSQGRPTKTMAANCGVHFAGTMSILEPTIVILQGAKVSAWSQETLAPTRHHTDHLYEAELNGSRVLVCTFSHPSAHAAQRWASPDAPYVSDVVAPTLKAALKLG
jgi:hypothetical protein